MYGRIPTESPLDPLLARARDPGVDARTVARLRRGLAVRPSTLRRVAEACAVDVETLELAMRVARAERAA